VGGVAGPIVREDGGQTGSRHVGMGFHLEDEERDGDGHHAVRERLEPGGIGVPAGRRRSLRERNLLGWASVTVHGAYSVRWNWAIPTPSMARPMRTTIASSMA